MKKKMIILIAALIVIIAFFIWFFNARFGQGKNIIYGVTFSKIYAEELDLDWRQTFLASLDELKIRNYRLPAYWDRLETKDNDYDFTDLDWQIAEAAKRQAKVILVIGQRVPRWPECFIPSWAKDLPTTQREEKLLEHLKVVVNHYKTAGNIIAWQVENEPLLSLFGDCPDPDIDFLKKEVDLVKSLDDRPIMITDSGELSLWLRTPKVADILGTSIYRSTYNKWWGYFNYFYPPAFYYLHAQLIKGFFPDLNRVIVSEFQFEPWARIKMTDLDMEEQYQSFNLTKFDQNLKFIRRSGFNEVYLWGVEWWYWLKEKKGISEFWEAAKKIEW